MRCSGKLKLLHLRLECISLNKRHKRTLKITYKKTTRPRLELMV
jgi:hypothetical protein